MPEIDWQRVAVRLALAEDGSYRRLTTAERDALDAAVEAEREAEWLAADTVAERTADVASGWAAWPADLINESSVEVER